MKQKLIAMKEKVDNVIWWLFMNRFLRPLAFIGGILITLLVCLIS